MIKEGGYLQEKPDILWELFRNYIQADFVVAGAEEKAVMALLGYVMCILTPSG